MPNAKNERPVIGRIADFLLQRLIAVSWLSNVPGWRFWWRNLTRQELLEKWCPQPRWEWGPLPTVGQFFISLHILCSAELGGVCFKMSKVSKVEVELHPRFPSRKCQRGQNWHEGLHNEVFIVIHRDANCTLQERECVCQAQFHFMQLWFSLICRKLCVQCNASRKKVQKRIEHLQLDIFHRSCSPVWN